MDPNYDKMQEEESNNNQNQSKMENQNNFNNQIKNSNAKKIGGGRYIINLSYLLGSGKFGKVYKAVQPKNSNLQYAVKVIDKAQLKNSYQTNALIREVNIMKSLKSPHIIALKDIVQSKNNIYIIQQLADITLQQYLSKQYETRLQQPKAISFLVQILQGLSQLIKNGIIHRDLKPANILIKQNILKIADFGLSRSDTMVALKTVVGSPLYMAPQLLNIKQTHCPYTYKCDIWSFGVICYQLVTGTFPWPLNKIQRQDQLLKIIINQLSIGIVYPENINISQNYKDLIRGCLKINQEDRYDWNQIFGHQLFDGYFQQSKMQQQYYTLTQLRMKVHTNNINLMNFFEHLPQDFDLKQFICIIRVLDQSITETQAEHLFINFVKQNNRISKHSLLQQLKKHDFETKKIKALQFPQNQSQETKKLNTEIKSIISNFKKIIHHQSINLFEIFKQFRQKHQQKINKQEFVQLMLKINKKGKKETKEKKIQQIQLLFDQFNFQGTEYISLSTFQQQFCKAIQIPVIKDSEISQQLMALKNKKKK